MVRVSKAARLTNNAVAGAAEEIYTVTSGEGTEFVLTDITIGNEHASSNIGVFLVESATSTTTVYGPVFANATGTTAITDIKNGPRFTSAVYAYANTAPSTAITVCIGGELE